MSRSQQLFALIAEELGVDLDRVTPDATLDELGADSLDVVEVSLAVEEHFDVVVSDADLDQWKTVADVAKSIVQAEADP